MAGNLKAAAVVRWSALFAGTLSFAWLFASSNERPGTAEAGLIFLLAGELIERHLFFRAVVPPKMPGFMTDL